MAPKLLLPDIMSFTDIPKPSRTAVFGSLLALLSVVLAFPMLRFFLDLPSFLITVGGASLVTLLSFSTSDLGGTISLVVEALRRPRASLDGLAAEVRSLASLYWRDGVKRLEAEEPEISDHFMRLAVARVVDWQSEDEIARLLAGEMVGFHRQVENAAKVLQTVGRLLPAFGLIGTLISLVLLLRASASPDPLAMAPALSLAVLTTLYGALLSNAVILPLANKVDARGETRLVEMRLIAEGVVMMAGNWRPSAIVEHLRTVAHGGEIDGSLVGRRLASLMGVSTKAPVETWMRAPAWEVASWRRRSGAGSPALNTQAGVRKVEGETVFGHQPPATRIPLAQPASEAA